MVCYWNKNCIIFWEDFIAAILTNLKKEGVVKQEKNIIVAVLMLILLTVLLLSVLSATAQDSQDTHPELDEQEMFIACSDCHRESTPDLEKEWYDSVHGIAMVKCYQCHGTFETFKVTPTREDCATCHADMLEKCDKNKPCWECHVPHSFKSEK